MDKIIKKDIVNGVEYKYNWIGWGGSITENNVIYISQADYDNLTPAEKADATKNYVIIGQGGIPVPTEIDAEDVSYDNTTSGLSATTVKDAIDEVNGKTNDTRNIYGDYTYEITNPSDYVVEDKIECWFDMLAFYSITHPHGSTSGKWADAWIQVNKNWYKWIVWWAQWGSWYSSDYYTYWAIELPKNEEYKLVSTSITSLFTKTQPVNVTFDYTWSDQHYTIPYTGKYIIECSWWGWSKWWYALWVFNLSQWDTFSIMVWDWWTRYWFWASPNWCWLSWVFVWDETITSSDASRALIIAWWAGWVVNNSWSAWGGENGEGWYEYNTASGNIWWSWWTQTWHWNRWNVWENQFEGWAWIQHWMYLWRWGWGWRWWWNWGQSDYWGGWGWSGYVKDTALQLILTTWWSKSSTNNWKVRITFIW